MKANITQVKHYYELQLASNGVLGNPTLFQAMEAVERKGIHGLKLKSSHCGPTNEYVERTLDFRVILMLSRHLVFDYRQFYLAKLAKLELEEVV